MKLDLLHPWCCKDDSTALLVRNCSQRLRLLRPKRGARFHFLSSFPLRPVQLRPALHYAAARAMCAAQHGTVEAAFSLSLMMNWLTFVLYLPHSAHIWCLESIVHRKHFGVIYKCQWNSFLFSMVIENKVMHQAAILIRIFLKFHSHLLKLRISTYFAHCAKKQCHKNYDLRLKF